jgi:hypothetical protein
VSGTRRGTYLSDREAAELERLSADSNLTPSSVLRTGLRLLAGLPIPRESLPLIEQARCTLQRSAP